MASTVEAMPFGEPEPVIVPGCDCPQCWPFTSRDFYPAAERLEAAIANAEVGPCR